MIREYWYTFRYWLASKIIGMDIVGEVDAAYEAGRQFGRTEKSGWTLQ